MRRVAFSLGRTAGASAARLALYALLLTTICAPDLVWAKNREEGEQDGDTRAPKRVRAVPTNRAGRSWKAPHCKLPAPAKPGIRKFRLVEPLTVASLASLAVGIATGGLIASLVVAPAFAGLALLEVKANHYDKMVEDNAINVDEYTCHRPNFYERAKVALMHGLSTGSHRRSARGIPIGVRDSHTVKGLKTTWALQGGKGGAPLDVSSKKAVVVGTIRMGFGHHRIAYSTASWALEGADFDQADPPPPSLRFDSTCMEVGSTKYLSDVLHSSAETACRQRRPPAAR